MMGHTPFLGSQRLGLGIGRDWAHLPRHTSWHSTPRINSPSSNTSIRFPTYPQITPTPDMVSAPMELDPFRSRPVGWKPVGAYRIHRFYPGIAAVSEWSEYRLWSKWIGVFKLTAAPAAPSVPTRSLINSSKPVICSFFFLFFSIRSVRAVRMVFDKSGLRFDGSSSRFGKSDHNDSCNAISFVCSLRLMFGFAVAI